jgi:hypothetical protein
MVLELLRSSPRLRTVARLDFAIRLAQQSNDHGHTGRVPLDLVLQAIREADVKVADREAATGETMQPREIGALVRGFVNNAGAAPRAGLRRGPPPAPAPSERAWSPASEREAEAS